MRSPALPVVFSLAALLSLPGCSAPGEAPAPASSSAPAPASPAASPASAASGTLLTRYQQAAGLSSRPLPIRLRGTGVGLVDGVEGNRRIVVQAEQPGRYRQFDGPGSSESPLRLTVFVVNGPDAFRVGSAGLAGAGQSSDPAVRQEVEADAARQNMVNTLAGVMPVWLARDPAVTMVEVGALPDGPFKGEPAVAVKFGGADPTHVVFDAETGLPKAAVVPFLKSIRPTGGTYTIRYEDYRDVDGLKLPFRLVREGAERARTRWMFRSWEIDPTFAATTFERAPAPKR